MAVGLMHCIAGIAGLLAFSGLLGRSFAAAGVEVDSGPGVLDPGEAFETSQAAIGNSLAPIRLITTDGEERLLTDFTGKPLVISLIYTSCHYICPTLTQQLADAVETARDALGENSFSVLSIGFDAANDTPERMRHFRREQGVEFSNWTFASVGTDAVEPLTRNLGFVFARTPGGFDHLMQTTVVDADGNLHLQIYGDLSEAPVFVEPLKQLIRGVRDTGTTLSDWWRRTRLFCTVYDPASGGYRFDYSFIIAILAGAFSLGATLIFLVRAWRQSGQFHSS